MSWRLPFCGTFSHGGNSADREALVASLGAFVALGDVSRQTTGEDQHLAPLAGDVGAQIPGVGAWKQGRVRRREHLRAPGLLGGYGCLDPGQIALAKIIEQSSDPVSLHLRASRPVAKSVRALRTVDEDKIRKAGHRHA